MALGLLLAAWLPFASAADCPFEVSRVCGRDCGSPAAACRAGAFSCDFKVCWATHLMVAGEDLARVLADPRSYSLGPRADALAGGVNFISRVDLIDAKGAPGLFLERGLFVLEIPSLTKAKVARGLLSWAQSCARDALFRNPDVAATGARSPSKYLVAGCGGPVRYVAQEEPDAAARRLDVDGLPRDMRLASEDQLRTYLMRTAGETEFSDEHDVFRVCGNAPFEDSDDPKDWDEAESCLDRKQRDAFDLLHSLARARVLEEAQITEPAPEGWYYDFDEETGKAVLESVDDDP